MKLHELKCCPAYFYRVWSGQKSFEIRKNDRDFQIGDLLLIKEYDPVKNEYTGGECRRTISYILHGGQFGIEEGYCVLSLKA